MVKVLVVGLRMHYFNDGPCNNNNNNDSLQLLFQQLYWVHQCFLVKLQNMSDKDSLHITHAASTRSQIYDFFYDAVKSQPA